MNTPIAVAAGRRATPKGTPMLALYATLATFITDLRTRTEGRLHDEDGFTTVEWVVIGSIAFAMAVAVGAGLTLVANNYMGKIN
jgi:hypothetical protein